jgi:predicted O-methyltransferase YrrM
VLELKRKTRKIRVFAAATCLKMLTPSFYKIAKDGIEGTENNDLPRPSTKLIHKVYGEKPLVGVEIGTGFGKNALNLLHELSIERLYCIDPFVPYFDGKAEAQTDYLSRSDVTLRVLAKYRNVTFIRKISSEACKEIPKSVDFVYIDGDHNYEYILGDLHNYFPLVHEKGVIAGHDIDWFDVRKAIDDFCRVKSITPLLRSPDWIIIK